MLSDMLPESAEMRAHPRHRTLKGGVIVFNSGRSTISCVMRDQSQGGAKLQFPTLIGVPREFDLLVSDLPRQHCRVAWAAGQSMGVAFQAA
ncbi:MAG: PilZ domain-containing protein [Devosia sp.]